VAFPVVIGFFPIRSPPHFKASRVIGLVDLILALRLVGLQGYGVESIIHSFAFFSTSFFFFFILTFDRLGRPHFYF